MQQPAHIWVPTGLLGSQYLPYRIQYGQVSQYRTAPHGMSALGTKRTLLSAAAPSTQPWRRKQSAANRSRQSNSLITGKLQGISSIGSVISDFFRQIRQTVQRLVREFPARSNREFNLGEQGRLGTYAAEQGIFDQLNPLVVAGLCWSKPCNCVANRYALKWSHPGLENELKAPFGLSVLRGEEAPSRSAG